VGWLFLFLFLLNNSYFCSEERFVKKLYTILFCLLGSYLFAQQDPLFTQYMYNKLEFNPAYAGSSEFFSADLITRFQWVGIPGAPKTFSLTAHSPLRNNHIGLGFSAYRDALGPTVDYNVMGTFAYRIIFPTTKLCFGISAGVKYYDIDFSQLNPKDAGDIELSNQVKNRAVPDADFGIYYYGKPFYVGISSRHLFQNQITSSSSPANDTLSFTKLLRHFYGLAGGAIPIGNDIVFMPSLLVKYVQHAPLQVDVSGCFMFYNTMVLGASYRSDKACGLILEFMVGKGFAIGYSYDIWFNSLKANNMGSHEIRLGYDIDLIGRNRMLSPRYF
jgi:type IX secretion system PorP/SprF family membrane protein